MLIDQRKLKLSPVKKTNVDARPPDHRHPHSNNQVSPCENLVKMCTGDSFMYLLGKEGYVFARVGLFVCNITQKLMNGFQ